MSENYPSNPVPNDREVALARARAQGTASLVLGILSLVSCFTGIGALPGFIAAIVGLVLGSKARKALPPTETGMATAGWVCSIIAICLCGVAIFLVFGLLSLMGLGAMVETSI